MYRFLESSVLGNKFEKTGYTVIGGGIAGLFMGYYLKRSGVNFRIIEIEKRTGGLIDTTHSRYGYTEHAARGFLMSRELRELCRNLNLPVIAPSRTSKAKYILINGKFKKMPLGIGELARMAGRMLTPKKGEFQTVDDFARHYFGAPAAEKLVGPAMAGIYAADIADLSFPAVFPEIAKIQQENRWILPSLINYGRKKAKDKLPKGTHSFPRGMNQLVGALHEYLHEHILTGEDGANHLNPGGRTIICTPAYEAVRFFKGHPVAEMLNRVVYIPMVSINVILDKKDVKRDIEGFGCVIPRGQGLSALGVIFNHHVFPVHFENENILSYTCIFRDNYQRSAHHTLLEMSDIALEKLALNELDELFGLKSRPEYFEIHRYEKGIPLYSPQLHNDIYEIDSLLKTDFPEINLFGNYTGEISIRGMCQAASKFCPGAGP